MNNKILIISVFMILLSSLSLATQTLQISSATTPSTVAPGNDGYITLTITNVGTTYVDTLKIKSIKIDSPIIMKSTLYQDSLGSLGPTKATSATIRFDVP
ncbi:MAG: hypothetical protein NT129_04375, partial [Candidatus Aenigmarchaeota archaeon]|nr:hypothetical protein [Candidatus Aenigmarchaeota archaeon]